jgi:hypothetical protein
METNWQLVIFYQIQKMVFKENKNSMDIKIKQPKILVVLILISFIVSCSAATVTKSDRLQDIPERAIWNKNKNRWVYEESDGTMTAWYSNGNKAMTGRIINNKSQGLFTVWYENGNKKMEGVYKNDLSIGLWQWWWPNSNLKIKGNYIDNKEDGLWEAWDENGAKMGETIYKNGIKISEKDFTKKKKA